MYEAYSDYHSMMNMAEEIVTRCALAVHGKLTIDYQVKKLSQLCHIFTCYKKLGTFSFWICLLAIGTGRRCNDHLWRENTLT